MLRQYENLINENYSLEPGDVVSFDNGKSYMYLCPAKNAPGNLGMLEPAFTTLEPEFPLKIFYIRNQDEVTLARFKPYKEGVTMNCTANDNTGKVEKVIGFINSPWWSSAKVDHINVEDWERALAEIDTNLVTI